MKQGWEIKKLGEVCDFQGGSQPPKEEWISEEREGYVRMLQIRDFTQTRSVEAEYVKITNRLKFCQSDDVLIGRYGASVGKILTGLSGAYNVAIMKSIPNSKVLMKPFFKYFLSSPSFQDFLLQASAMRAAQAGFSKEDIQDYPLPVPPIAEQEKIVAELDCLSGIIEKKKQQLKELDNLAQSIFYEMFGDPVENDKGWDVKKFGDVANSELGKMLDSKKNQGELYPYLCSANVQWNDVDCTQVKEMRFEEDELERYRVYKGDLLICEGGDTGRCAIWKSDNAIYYQNALHRVRFVDGLMLPIFCLYTMKCYKERGEIDKYSSGQTIKHLVKKVLLTIPLIVPPLFLQQDFASKIESIEKQKELIAHSIKEAETLFNSRMNDYFN